MENERLNEIKEQWAEAVGCDDPDSLDDWPVELIEQLLHTIRDTVDDVATIRHEMEKERDGGDAYDIVCQLQLGLELVLNPAADSA